MHHGHPDIGKSHDPQSTTKLQRSTPSCTPHVPNLIPDGTGLPMTTTHDPKKDRSFWPPRKEVIRGVHVYQPTPVGPGIGVVKAYIP